MKTLKNITLYDWANNFYKDRFTSLSNKNNFTLELVYFNKSYMVDISKTSKDYIKNVFYYLSKNDFNEKIIHAKYITDFEFIDYLNRNGVAKIKFSDNYAKLKIKNLTDSIKVNSNNLKVKTIMYLDKNMKIVRLNSKISNYLDLYINTFSQKNKLIELINIILCNTFLFSDEKNLLRTLFFFSEDKKNNIRINFDNRFLGQTENEKQLVDWLDKLNKIDYNTLNSEYKTKLAKQVKNYFKKYYKIKMK